MIEKIEANVKEAKEFEEKFSLVAKDANDLKAKINNFKVERQNLGLVLQEQRDSLASQSVHMAKIRREIEDTKGMARMLAVKIKGKENDMSIICNDIQSLKMTADEWKKQNLEMQTRIEELEADLAGKVSCLPNSTTFRQF